MVDEEDTVVSSQKLSHSQQAGGLRRSGLHETLSKKRKEGGGEESGKKKKEKLRVERLEKGQRLKVTAAPEDPG